MEKVLHGLTSKKEILVKINPAYNPSREGHLHKTTSHLRTKFFMAHRLSRDSTSVIPS